MRLWFRYCVCAVVLGGFAPQAWGGLSGYAEYGVMHDDNYNMADEPAERIPETMHVFTAALTQAQPVSGATSLLLTGGFRYATYARFPDLGGTTYYVNGGIYHRTSYLRSYSMLIGAYHKNHRAESQNEDGYSARFSPVQRLSPVYWLMEHIFYEKGGAELLTDKYRSYGVSIRLSRFMPGNRSWLTPSLTIANKTYDDYFQRAMTAYQLGLEWTCPFGKQFYVRAAGLYTLAQSQGDFDYRSRVGSVMVGYGF